MGIVGDGAGVFNFKRGPMNKPVKKSEHQEQCALIEWCRLHENVYPMLKWIYAVPNGARTSISVAKRLKAEGLKASVPDICLPYPRYTTWVNHENAIEKDCKAHGIYIEMKVKGGSVKKHQQEWIDYLNTAGYVCKVAWSQEEAIEIIKEYLK